MHSAVAALLAFGMLTASSTAAVLLAADLRPDRTRQDTQLRLLGVAQLALTGLTWLAVNSPVEGPVLLSLTPDNGLTVADLVTVIPAGLALWLLGGLHRPATPTSTAHPTPHTRSR